MIRFLLWFCPALREPGGRLLILSYMGSPLEAALPFRQRIAARLIGWYIGRNEALLGGSDL